MFGVNGRIFILLTSISSVLLQVTDKVTTNMLWMIIAILFTVMAILLTIANITIGAMLCHTRKSVKTVSTSKLTTHQQGIQVHTFNAVN